MTELLKEFRQLFETDGFRGEYEASSRAGQINAPTYERLAHSSVEVLMERGQFDGEKPVFMIGRDTRSSGPELHGEAIQGLLDAGAEVWDMGVVPTPLIAWAAQKASAAAIAITASHNPDKYNGFKLFGRGGAKLERDGLDAVNKHYWDHLESALPMELGTLKNGRGFVEDYLAAVTSKLGGSEALAGKLIAVDGANGAGYDLAPRLYRALGADVITFACDPATGVINKDCGAAKLKGMERFLTENPDLLNDPRFIGGVAHDGDADRVLGYDRHFRIIDGNHWMHELALDGDQEGIVGTIYTNSALRQALKQTGIEFHQCDNGDSYVTEMLRQTGLTRGGEFTGHLIDLEHLSSGDGPYMAAWLVTKLVKQDMTFEDVADNLKVWPELMVNVELPTGTKGKPIVASDEVQAAIKDQKDKYGDSALIVLRPSGTEPVIRVWANAEDQTIVDDIVSNLAGTIHDAVLAA